MSHVEIVFSYVYKWIKLFKSTTPIDRIKAEKNLSAYLNSRKFSQLKIQPDKFVFLESPLACESLIKSLINENSNLDFGGNLLHLLNNWMSKIHEMSLGFNLYTDSSIRNIYEPLHKNILEELSSSSPVVNKFQMRKDEPKTNDFGILHQLGNFNYYYCGILDYLFSEVIKPDKTTLEFWNLYKQVSEELHCFFIFRNTVYISEKPIHFHLDDYEQLHNEFGPAYGYSDGTSLYFLNGVKVSEEIVMTPRERLDGKLILTEVNAEVRKEIIRKIGIEKVMADCRAEVVESSDDGMYDLLKLKVPNSRLSIRYYLKMRNPSIPVYHIEGVSPECDTIHKALNFRAGGVDLNPQFMA